MTFGGIEEMQNKVISNTFDGHRLLNYHQMFVDICFKVEYDMIGMF